MTKKISAYLTAVQRYFYDVDAAMTAWLQRLSEMHFIENNADYFYVMASLECLGAGSVCDQEGDSVALAKFKKQLRALKENPLFKLFGSLENLLLDSKRHDTFLYGKATAIIGLRGIASGGQFNQNAISILTRNSLYPEFTRLLYSKLNSVQQRNARIIISNTERVGDLVDVSPAIILTPNALFYQPTPYQPLRKNNQLVISQNALDQLQEMFASDDEDASVNTLLPLTSQYYQSFTNVIADFPTLIGDVSYQLSTTNEFLPSLQAVMFENQKWRQSCDFTKLPKSWAYDRENSQDLANILIITEHFNFSMAKLTAFVDTTAAEVFQPLVTISDENSDQPPLLTYLSTESWPRQDFMVIVITHDILSTLLADDKSNAALLIEKLNALLLPRASALRDLAQEINAKIDKLRHSLQPDSQSVAQQTEVLLLQWGLKKFKQRVFANFLNLPVEKFNSHDYVFELAFLCGLQAINLSYELASFLNKITADLLTVMKKYVPLQNGDEELLEIIHLLQEKCFKKHGGGELVQNLLAERLAQESFKNSASKAELETLMFKGALTRPSDEDKTKAATLKFQGTIVNYFCGLAKKTTSKNYSKGNIEKTYLLEPQTYAAFKQGIQTALEAYRQKLSPLTFYRRQRVKQLVDQLATLPANDMPALLHCLTSMSVAVADEDFTFNSSSFGFARNASGSRLQRLLSDLCYRTAAAGIISEQYETQERCQSQKIDYVQAMLAQLQTHLGSAIFNGAGAYIEKLKAIINKPQAIFSQLATEIVALNADYHPEQLTAKQRAVFYFVDSLHTHLNLTNSTTLDLEFKWPDSVVGDGIALSDVPFAPVSVEAKAKEIVEPLIVFNKGPSYSTLEVESPAALEVSYHDIRSPEWDDLLKYGSQLGTYCVDVATQITDACSSLSSYLFSPPNEKSIQAGSAFNRPNVQSESATPVCIEMMGLKVLIREVTPSGDERVLSQII